MDRILPELEELDEDDIAAYLAIQARRFKADADLLRDAYKRRLSDVRDPAELSRELRSAEYEALGRLHPEEDGTETFVCYPESVDRTAGFEGIVELVSRVSRLREVRALSGFTRVNGVVESKPTPTGSLSRARSSWLPAIEVLGEGLFVRLSEDAVHRWEISEFALERAELLSEAVRNATPERIGQLPPINPRFLLLHSLSHVLMRELALDTGYPASSIRERIYADPGQSGLLLYTATADAAGSLGGLCSHGTAANVTRLLHAATESAQWCSADPVCLESLATGAGAVNLAACHSCMLAPEVSCEHQNRYLDRACLVGTDGLPEGGLLTDLHN